MRTAAVGLALALGILGGLRFSKVRAGTEILAAADDDPFVDARWTREPLLANLQITITPPAYTGAPSTTLDDATGDLQVVQGSVIAVSGTTTRDFAEVTMLWQAGTTASADAASTKSLRTARRLDMTKAPAATPGPIRWAGTFTANETASYRFMVGGAHEHQIETRPRSVAIEVDRAPAVRLFAPNAATTASTRQVVELAFVTDDDFGLAATELVWEHDGKVERQPLELDVGRRHHEGTVAWHLSDLGITSSPTTVRYHIEVQDNNTLTGPGVGRSAQFSLRVTDPVSMHEHGLDALEGLIAAMLDHLAGELRHGMASAKAVRDRLAATLPLATSEALFATSAVEALRRAAATWEMLDGSRDGSLRIASMEASILELDDWHERLRRSGYASIVADIRDMMQRLAKVLAHLSSARDERVHRQALRLVGEIARASSRLAQRTAEAEAEAAAANPAMYLNPGLRASAQPAAACIDDVGGALRRYDVSAAKAALAACEAAWSRHQAEADQALAEFRAARFGAEQKLLDVLVAALTHGAAQAGQISIATRQIATSQRSRRPRGIMTSEQLVTLKRELATVRAMLVDVPAAGLTQAAADEFEIARRRVLEVIGLLDGADVFEATQRAQLAALSLDSIRGELEAAIAEEPLSTWNDLTGDALARIETARARMRALADRLALVRPSPAALATSAERSRFAALRTVGAKLRTDLATATAAIPQGTALSPALVSELTARLASATMANGEADIALIANDAIGAREHSGAALHHLDAALAALTANSRGQTSVAPIALPRTLHTLTHDAPTKFREELTRAMATPAVNGTTELVKRYYEGLIK
ncbi:MAG: hypothetical protein IPL79_00720 [Myxococcales bacterium]|nr:hypothetical protein [Myxococcales bacterium]